MMKAEENIRMVIDMIATGENIKSLTIQNDISVADLQHLFGFRHPTAIYKWFRGDSIPSVDNLVILAQYCNTTIDEILVTSTFAA